MIQESGELQRADAASQKNHRHIDREGIVAVVRERAPWHHVSGQHPSRRSDHPQSARN